MKEQLHVVKIGSILESAPALEGFIRSFSRMEGRKILVHGGGKKATEYAERIGVSTRMIDGRRVTNDDMLEVVTMVYAGWLSKSIVAKCHAYGCNALGLSGADGNVVLASKRPVKDGIDYGWAGDVVDVHTKNLRGLIESDFVPVVNSITHNGGGQLLNTNADTIATRIATAMAPDYEVQLIYLFDKPGVMSDVDDEDSVIQTLEWKAYNEMKMRGIINSGMIPKLDNAFTALDEGVHSLKLGSAVAFEDILEGGRCTTLRS